MPTTSGSMRSSFVDVDDLGPAVYRVDPPARPRVGDQEGGRVGRWRGAGFDDAESPPTKRASERTALRARGVHLGHRGPVRSAPIRARVARVVHRERSLTELPLLRWRPFVH